jgi:hypothetical protein
VRVRLRVVSGSGGCWLGDRIDSRTGDPANVEIGGASIGSVYVAKLDNQLRHDAARPSSRPG